MGYKKKQDVAFPRTQGYNEGYFYPRPVYQPLNLRTTANPGPLFKQFNGQELTADPFQAQSYYYPAPYLHLPMPDVPRSFQQLKLKKNKKLRPKIYVLPVAVRSADGMSSEIRFVPSTIDFGTLRAMRGHAKAIPLEEEISPRKQQKKAKGVIEDVAGVVEEDKIDEDLLEEMLDAVEYELGVDDGDKEKKKIAQVLPNDKFLNSKLIEDSASDEKDEADSELDMLILNKSIGGTGRSFNISATFQNFTNRFSILPSSSPATTLPSEIKDLKELPEGTAESTTEAELPQEKGPFGFFNRQSDPSNGGGLVIQRLRVRQGGIAIAGPGGVATAGSGGTAIVGPNGTAITHPRSLTIAGPGAKIYAVPESVDLEKTINATKRSLPLDAVLVASGPVVYYRN
ncbi:uncharacterized protein LOC131692934 [Topomyia yanbarensis]|uniref:uncharacterized protein LOC131692934 n=1 Tax=Topomyia yanbarensis TaxID=2498891 RepID=UPI00273CAB31|nr:uncharacterized protein LOC131692934 [Topomyia yanbarensis]